MNRHSHALVCLCFAVVFGSVEERSLLAATLDGSAQITAGCSYAINPTTGNHSGAGGSGGFSVFALSTCHWTPIANDNWIHTSGGSSGGGSVAYTVDPNPNPSYRVGSIQIEDQTYTIRQSGNGCDAVLSPTNGSHGATSEAGSFSLKTAAGCLWAASTGFTWIHTSSTGTGPGTVHYTVDAYPGAGTRTGTIRALEQTFTVTQMGELEKPAITPILDQKLSPGTASAPISFHLLGSFDLGTASIWASSSNLAIIPMDNILLAGSGSDRIILLIPAPGAVGISRINILATDEAGASASTSFAVTVGNPPPVFRGNLVRRDSAGNVILSISGPPGGSILIQRSSELRTWTELTTLPNPSGDIDYTDTSAPAAGPRFYRLLSF